MKSPLENRQVLEKRMKKETLAKRIAEKSGEPVLEKVILGNATVQEIPERCMPWQGKVTGSKHGRVRKRRDYDFLLYQIGTFDHLRPVIRFQKKEHGVHRLLVEGLMETDYPLRLIKTCGTERCVNPLHFVPKEIRSNGFTALPDEVDVIQSDEDWAIEEVEEVVEIALTENYPGNWQELMTLPILEGVPPKLAENVLTKLNRLHLLPPS